MGGQSSRMKSPKEDLIFQGKKWIDHQLSTLTKTLKGIPSFVVVSGKPKGYPSVKDIKKNLGPLGGIYSVLRNFYPILKNSSILFIPIDMPFLSEKSLKKLIQAPVTQNIDYIGFKSYELPFLLKISEKTVKLAQSFCDDSICSRDRSIKKFLACLNSRIIGVPKQLQFEFCNINTPEEWKLLYEHSIISE